MQSPSDTTGDVEQPGYTQVPGPERARDVEHYLDQKIRSGEATDIYCHSLGTAQGEL